MNVIAAGNILVGRTRDGPGEMHRSAVLERLEDRTLLASLNISGGALSYLGGVNVANNLSISTTGAAGKYTFADTETITLVQRDRRGLDRQRHEHRHRA